MIHLSGDIFMEKILIIEDDKSVRKSIIDLLEFSGYETNSAENGKEALELMHQQIPDLIISDIMMPELDGVDLLKQVRSKTDTATLPFIFLTAKTEYKDLRIGMNYGADDYIIKPFKANELLEAIRTRLTKKNSQVENFSYIRSNITRSIPNIISNPLLNIAGYAEILRDELSSLQHSEIKEYAQRIIDSQNDLTKLINKYTSYTDSVFLLLNRSAYNYLSDSTISFFKNICTQIIYEAADNSERKKDLDISLEEGNINISTSHFYFIIKELVQNAVKHSLPDTKIKIEGKVIKNQYHLFSTNHCSQYSNEIWQKIKSHSPMNNKIFEQNNPKLGLVTIKNILGFYNGELLIENEELGICKITLRLPIK